MTELSHAAQAIDFALYGPGLGATRRQIAAAVLRAAAMQSTFADVAVNKTIEVVPVDILLAIADELEGIN